MSTRARAPVYITRRLPLDAHEILGEHAFEVFAEPRPPTREELIGGARGARALVTMLTDQVDEALLDALPDLEIVANVAVGHDNIDVDACDRRGVFATNTPAVLTEATADLTLALILAVARRITEGDRMVRAGGFNAWSPTLLLGMELGGATLGIFGHGRIGQAVARRARAFGMQVIYTRRGTDSASVDKGELLQRADIVTIHCPLTEATRHAFDAQAFAQMRRHALLINTSRGPIVDEAALVDALVARRLAGAGLDVYEREPAVHPGLLARDDVVLLPHLGSATELSRRRMATAALENVRAVLDGGAARDLIRIC